MNPEPTWNPAPWRWRPSLFSEDADRNRASLRALESLTFDTIADGHAGVTSNAKEKLARLLALRQ